MDIFFRCFRLPKEGAEGMLLSSTDIFCRLQKKYPAAFRGSNIINMGKLLVGVGVERVRNRYGSAYRVVPMWQMLQMITGHLQFLFTDIEEVILVLQMLQQ